MSALRHGPGRIIQAVGVRVAHRLCGVLGHRPAEESIGRVEYRIDTPLAVYPLQLGMRPLDYRQRVVVAD